MIVFDTKQKEIELQFYSTNEERKPKKVEGPGCLIPKRFDPKALKIEENHENEIETNPLESALHDAHCERGEASQYSPDHGR